MTACIPPFLARWLAVDLARSIVTVAPYRRGRQDLASLAYEVEMALEPTPATAVVLPRRTLAQVLPALEAAPWTHAIDLSGAYLPRQYTPLVLLFSGRPGPTARVLRCVRGEPVAPADPERGIVWRAILAGWDSPGAGTGVWTTTVDVPRAEALATLCREAWDLDDHLGVLAAQPSDTPPEGTDLAGLAAVAARIAAATMETDHPARIAAVAPAPWSLARVEASARVVREVMRDLIRGLPESDGLRAALEAALERCRAAERVAQPSRLEADRA